MHKRLITILATLLCVAACAFGLVACNNTVAVESVTLDKTSVTLQVGGEETLTATVTPDNATDKAVTWSSDNTAVATVANGKVTAVSAGTATVTATAGGKSATCAVTVETVKTVTSEQWKQAMESADKFFINAYDGVYLDLFVEAFANFSFDKDINAYVGEIDDTTAIVTITDGKIVSVVVGTDKLEFTDYGTTVINLPKAA